MLQEATKIHLASNLLRSPHLFDGLGPADKPGEGPTRKGRRKYGAATGGILRDLILFAAWKNELVCELKLPEFCKMMGYDSANLTRRCSEEEVEEIKRTGWPEKWVDTFSNALGLALVRLISRNLIVPDKNATAERERIAGARIVEHVDVFEARATGTLLSFTLSKSILSKNRREFQTPILEEYLSLRTESTTRQENHPGHPDDAARRMYLRLTWLRQYYDYLVKNERYADARNLLNSTNEYDQLVLVAGLGERRSYWPEKRVAHALRQLLLRVGSMASIRMLPQVKGTDGKYEVVWRAQQEAEADEPEPEATPYTPTAQELTKLTEFVEKVTAPPAAKPTRKAKRKQPSVPSHQIKPAPRPTRPVAPAENREKLLGELESARNSLSWLQSDDARRAKAYATDSQLLEQHQEQARVQLKRIQTQLGAS